MPILHPQGALGGITPVQCWLWSFSPHAVLAMAGLPRALAHLKLMQSQGEGVPVQTSRHTVDFPRHGRLIPCYGGGGRRSGGSSGYQDTAQE